MLRTSVLIALLLVASIAFADLAEDIVGTWTLVSPIEIIGMPIIITFNADGTYEIQVLIDSMPMPIEQGTYAISGTDVTVYPEEDVPSTFQNVTVVGDQLSYYDPEEDETFILLRGSIAPEPLGTGSISGMIIYDGELSSEVTVMAFAGEVEDETMPVGMVILPQVGTYTIEGLPDGAYVVSAMLGSPLEEDEESPVVGIYGVDIYQLDLEPELVVVAEGAHVEGIDIILYSFDEPSSAQSTSWGAIKAAF